MLQCLPYVSSPYIFQSFTELCKNSVQCVVCQFLALPLSACKQMRWLFQRLDVKENRGRWTAHIPNKQAQCEKSSADCRICNHIGDRIARVVSRGSALVPSFDAFLTSIRKPHHISARYGVSSRRKEQALSGVSHVTATFGSWLQQICASTYK